MTGAGTKAVATNRAVRPAARAMVPSLPATAQRSCFAAVCLPAGVANGVNPSSITR